MLSDADVDFGTVVPFPDSAGVRRGSCAVSVTPVLAWRSKEPKSRESGEAEEEGGAADLEA